MTDLALAVTFADAVPTATVVAESLSASPGPGPGPSLVPLVAEGGEVSIGRLRGAIIALLVAIGCFFVVVGTVGLIRLPTIYNRMHATSKATTLGAGVVALAGVVYYGFDPASLGGDGMLALVTVVFLFLTAPTGAHMISRAAQRMGVPFVDTVTWPGTATSRPEEPADAED